MKGSFEVTKTWIVPGEIVDRPVHLQVGVEPLESEFVSRYRNRVRWIGAIYTDLGWLPLFHGTKIFATNANTEEDIIAAIKEKLRVI